MIEAHLLFHVDHLALIYFVLPASVALLLLVLVVVLEKAMRPLLFLGGFEDSLGAAAHLLFLTAIRDDLPVLVV